jgi:hypothetical protein
MPQLPVPLFFRFCCSARDALSVSRRMQQHIIHYHTVRTEKLHHNAYFHIKQNEIEPVFNIIEYSLLRKTLYISQ